MDPLAREPIVDERLTSPQSYCCLRTDTGSTRAARFAGATAEATLSNKARQLAIRYDSGSVGDNRESKFRRYCEHGSEIRIPAINPGIAAARHSRKTCA